MSVLLSTYYDGLYYANVRGSRYVWATCDKPHIEDAGRLECLDIIDSFTMDQVVQSAAGLALQVRRNRPKQVKYA